MKYPLIAVLFLVTGLASTLLLLQAEQGDRFRPLNQAFLDRLISTTANRRKLADVTFLSVRPADFEKGDMAPRLSWAILLNSLLNFEPQAAGIVPPLRWDDRDILTEGALAKQIKRMPPMALGAILSPSLPEAGQEGLEASFLTLNQIAGDRGRLLEARQVAAMPDGELLINGKPGFTHIELQKELASSMNGLRLPLICRLGDRVVPSFLLQMVMLREGLLPGDVVVRLDHPDAQIQLGDEHTIPIDASGCMEVHPAMLDAFPRIDFASLALAVSPFQEVAEDLRKASKEELESLRKNLVVIGFDDDSLQEIALPGAKKVSRAQLLSAALAAIRSGFYITSWPQPIRYGSWGVLALLGLLVLAMPRWLSAAAGLVLGALYLAGTWFFFQQSLTWTPPWPALMLCLLMAILGTSLPRKTRRKRWFTRERGAARRGKN